MAVIWQSDSTQTVFKSQLNVILPRPQLPQTHPDEKAARSLLPRENDYRTPISKYPTAERLNDHDTVQLRDVQGTLNASGAFIDEYHLSQHASFDNQQGRFGFIAKGRLPVADVLHAALNPTKVVWEKKVVGPFDDGKLFLCHGDNCTICTTQALPGLGGEKYLVVKAGGRRERIS